MRLATRARVAATMAVLLVASLLSVSASAAAGGGDDEKEARRLFERAELEFNVGKFAEALTDYQSAYEAKPLPGFLFNIAQCYRNMGNYERARFFFRRYLALDPHASNRHRVDELIAEMSRQLDAKVAESSAVMPPSANPPPAVEPTPVDAPAPAGLAPAVSTSSSVPAPAEPNGASASLVAATAPPRARRPVWKRWWFWTGVAVVAGGAVATFFLTRPQTRTPGSLDPIDGRMP
jgi:hypothetical protein